MKYFICLILIFAVHTISFSQHKQTVEKDIKEITNFLKNDNLISFFKKHQSYRQLLEDYMKNGDTLRYKRMSDSSDYKYNNAMYGDNIVRNFLNCKKIFTVDNKKIKIDWKHSFIKEILIEENRISQNDLNQEVFIPVKVLVSNTQNNDLLIISISLMYAKSGPLMSFRILEDIHIGFSSIKEYVKFENEKMTKLLTDGVQNAHRNELKRIDNSESFPDKQYQKTYVSENNNAHKLILTFETKEDTTFLRLVNRIINGNLKHHKSFGQWGNWEGIIIFNPYGSETTWYMYEEEEKIKCFSIDSYITDIDKLEMITFNQSNNHE
ncbi:hypothetical protein MKJ01_07810 [Chryseobacterium sp. SSA4.19]|uniref:hypothetical protein n=1 Tax=Chryseobacterium sp. SSA4.19 TaxID=2919915 RepID=UPI001F4E0505|nr:hypothetical protein [Chryseobacterium sp. SSA4.19]MCJ8153669.1 hypothetical protein [Chryseobacterium sp. SSA4.19]